MPPEHEVAGSSPAVRTIAAGSNRLLSLTDGTGTRSLSYDSSGNITGDTRLDGTVFAYDYDHAGQLSEVTRSGSTDVTYLHDNLGHRVAKLSNVPGIASAHYLHGLAGGLLAEASTTGVTTTEYLWLDGLPLVLITDANTASPRIHWVHTDHLGTPQKLTDSTGAVVWDAVATPFGERASVTGSLTQPLRLPGQYADLETGLHQNWWRDYDPTLGRYIQADPIGLAGGSNLYGYANADPLRFTDPDGRVAGILVGPIVRAGIGRAAGQAIASALRNGLGDAVGTVASCLLIGICTNEMAPPDDPGQEAAKEAEPEQCEPDNDKERGNPYRGTPGEWVEHPHGKQDRLYGDDGEPAVDIDYGHDHGQGSPHAHNWDKGERGPGYPVSSIK